MKVRSTLLNALAIVISAGIATGYGGLYVDRVNQGGSVSDFHERAASLIGRALVDEDSSPYSYTWGRAIGEAIVLFSPPATLSILLFLVFCPPVWRLGSSRRETRCRKCGLILRGLDRPECSECGERI